MENNKDIGKIFREKIDQLEKSPSNQLWSTIEKDLDSKEERKIPFFSIFSTLLIAGLIVGGLFLNTNQSNDNQRTNQEINLKNNSITTHYKQNDLKDNTNPITQKNQPLPNSNTKDFTSKTPNTVENKNQIKTSPNFQSKNDVLTKNDTITFIQKNKTNIHSKKQDGIQNKTKSLVLSDTNPDKKGKKFKTTYYYETSKLVNTSKRLIKSSDEYTEYEVVKKYTYIVKKEKKRNSKFD